MCRIETGASATAGQDAASLLAMPHRRSPFLRAGSHYAVAPRAVRVWLVAVGLAGLVLGLAQEWRGAHYMSHTLWTAWVCWSVALVIDAMDCCTRDARNAKA